MSTGATHELLEIGVISPEPMPTAGPRRRRGRLPDHRGEGRPAVAGRRHGHRRGQAGARESLGGYRDPKPMVYSGLYPIDGSDYPLLRDALDRLRLNDAALVYEPESSRRARVRLPLRLPRPAAPGDHPRPARARVRPRPDLHRAERRLPGRARGRHRARRHQPVRLAGRQEDRRGPRAGRQGDDHRAERVHRRDHGAVPGPARQRCAGMDYLSETRVELRYTLPLAEIIFDFFDQLKSRTRGYASLDYELAGEQERRPGQGRHPAAGRAGRRVLARSCTRTRPTPTARR